MALQPGTKLGEYDVRELIGAGGMGEVYRATDTKLGRDVALKLLPEGFARDRERLARFKREAKLLASLNHPNIAVIHGLEESDGVHFLVMELVPGETLAERVAGGPLPVPEALKIGRQVADALEHAHKKNITHRDIKPANIKVTPEGIVKVLDFGLAKAFADEAVDPSEASTLSAMPTEDGRILGTPTYMSPEQAQGKQVDRQTDIWAFGCVLYELLTAKRAFPGENTTQTIAAVLRSEPDWQKLPQATPPPIRELLRRCLQKDQSRRLHSAADAALEIEDARSAPASVELSAAPVVPHRPGWGQMMRWAVAAVALLLAVALSVWYLGRRPAQPEIMRLSVATPGMASYLSVSPNGKYLTFSAADSSGRPLIWIRPVDSLTARPLPGTEHAAFRTFWSPDSRYLGFFADGKLKTVDVSSGTVQNVAEALSGRGGTWNRDGTIVFAPQVNGGLARVSEAGGVVSPVTTLDSSRQETGHRYPQFLPDGRHFVYFAATEQRENAGIYVASLDSKGTHRVLGAESLAAYSPPGYLLFLREEALMAQPFDADRLELTGEPVHVADGVVQYRLAAIADFDVSETGVLAYIDAASLNTRLVWFDRSGKELGTIGPPLEYGNLVTPELSPDGKRIAMAPGPQGSEDLWLWDVAGGTTSRFTFDPARDSSPQWSPDGSRIIFRSNREGRRRSHLYEQTSSGEGNEVRLYENAGNFNLNLHDWSSDGRFVVYATVGENTGFDLWALPLSGDSGPAGVEARKPFAYLQTEGNQSQAQFSPDGRWMAYVSNESGRDEVYIQSFPTPGSKRQVSAGGGVQPRWRRDGSELFYLANDLKLMAVPVGSDPAMGRLEIGSPTTLFETRLSYRGTAALEMRQSYDVTADGQRFLLNLPANESGSTITVILNWTAGLKQKVPTGN